MIFEKSSDEREDCAKNGFPFEYELIRTRRRTISVCVDRLGKVTVRAPARCADERIFAFLTEKRAWIERQSVRAKEAAKQGGILKEAEDGASFLWLGEYKSVSVNGARSRWGSCSFDNKLHFSFRLMYAPPEVTRYVAIHELAHTFEKNHSARFWAIVARYEPEFRKNRAFLKNNAYYMDIF